MKYPKILAVLLILSAFLSTVFADGAPELGLNPDARTLLTLEAAITAKESYGDTPYSLTGGSAANCSGFISRFLTALGYQTETYVDEWYQYQPDPQLPVPNRNTYMQLAWFQSFDETTPAVVVRALPVEDILTLDKFAVANILPGSLIFFQTEDSHLDYNQVSHVAVLLGYTVEDHQPLFADFAAGMKHGPILGRTLPQIALGMFETDSNGNYLTEPEPTGANTPDHLYAFIVDPLVIGQTLGFIVISDS